MKPKKQRGNEPSIKEKLSAGFLKAMQEDFAENGVEVIRQLRLKSPEKYADIASRLIAATEPPSEGFKGKTPHDIAIGCLQGVGMSEYDITEEMIAKALAAHDELMATLYAIRDAAQGPMQ